MKDKITYASIVSSLVSTQSINSQLWQLASEDDIIYVRAWYFNSKRVSKAWIIQNWLLI